MTKRQIDVGALRIGMYVTELDRPWTDTPFLFQGFVVSSHPELAQLRETCRFVYVDDAPNVDESERTIRRSMSVRADSEQGRSQWQRIASAERRVSFERGLCRANVAHQHTRQYVENLLKDARFGKAVDTEAAKAVVSEMVDSVTSDTDAALWLTQLKRADEYTAQHCVNVAVLSVAFAAHLGYAHEQLKTIGLGALLHDIGKMRVPPHVLNKSGPLTQIEFEIVKRHPVDGYEMLKATNQIPAQALQIVRFHHERLSGKGYPDGLGGDQLPTSVLLVAICDVYDALTSDRVYHQGLPADQSLQAMFQMAPANFGKALIHEFIKCIGIYPVGSLVQLATGAIGVVMTKDPLNKLRPVVMLVRDPHGREYRPRRFVSLAAQMTLERRHDWSVVRVLDPNQCDVDLHQIANDELLTGGHQVLHV